MRLLLGILILLPLAAQQPGEGKKRAMQPPKNLKLLQPSEIRSTMAAFRQALGVKCEYCHVQGDFASDDNPHKGIARNMIVMTREINTKFTDGKQHVTCFTCHRGASEPLTAPPAAGETATPSGTNPHEHEHHDQ